MLEPSIVHNQTESQDPPIFISNVDNIIDKLTKKDTGVKTFLYIEKFKDGSSLKYRLILSEDHIILLKSFLENKKLQEYTERVNALVYCFNKFLDKLNLLIEKSDIVKTTGKFFHSFTITKLIEDLDSLDENLVRYSNYCWEYVKEGQEKLNDKYKNIKQFFGYVFKLNFPNNNNNYDLDEITNKIIEIYIEFKDEFIDQIKNCMLELVYSETEYLGAYCLICLEIAEDPVIVPNFKENDPYSSTNYCKKCIVPWVEMYGTNPKTKESLSVDGILMSERETYFVKVQAEKAKKTMNTFLQHLENIKNRRLDNIN